MKNEFISFLQMLGKLQESENKYKTLFDTINESLVLFKIVRDDGTNPCDYRFMKVNPAFEKLTSWKRCFLIGQSLFKIIPNLDPAWLGYFNRVVNTGETSTFEHFSPRFSKYFEVNAFTPDKETLALLMIDITRIKKLEENYQEQLHFVQNLIDTIPSPVFFKDTSGIYQGCNKSFETCMGIPKEEIIGRTFLDIGPSGLAETNLKMDKLLLENPGVQCYEGKLPFSDGTLHDVIYNKAPIRSMSNKLTGLIAVTVDITKRKEAENALKHSETQLRRITSNMKDIICQINTEKVIEYVSPSCTNVLGYNPAELMGKKVFDYMHPEDTNRTWIDHKGKLVFRLRHKSGEWMWFEATGNQLRNDNGVELGLVFGVRDITETQRLESEMARLDRLRLAGEMAASIGHEIRNPLTTIQGLIQIIRNEPELSGFYSYFDLILEELDATNKIISEFLSLAQNKPINLRRQNLNTLIRTFCPLITAEAIKTDKQVILELGDIPDINIDVNEIRQLILNLTLNGLEAMQAGGKLEIKTFMNGDNVVLSIKDEGGGINPEVYDILGTPFVTTKEKGTGLGLAVCYSIAARHHAKIEVETGPIGTTFLVEFGCCTQLKGP